MFSHLIAGTVWGVCVAIAVKNIKPKEIHFIKLEVAGNSSTNNCIQIIAVNFILYIALFIINGATLGDRKSVV